MESPNEPYSERIVVLAAEPALASPGGTRSAVQNRAQGRGEGVGLTHAAVLAAQEPVVTAGEGDGRRPQPDWPELRTFSWVTPSRPSGGDG